MKNMTPLQALKKAVDVAGGQTRLATKLGGPVKQAHVWKWLNGTRLPAEYCRDIERITTQDGCTVTRYELRPDVFGPDPAKKKGQAA